VTLGCGYSLYRLLGQQLSNSIGQLSAIAGPIVDAVTLEVNGRWGCTGIVGAYNLYRTAITRTIFFNNYDAIVGLLTRSNARQTDHQHWECLSKHFILGDITKLSGFTWTGNG
jgi:hypothetical protein